MSLIEDVTKYRRDLHQIPELELHVPKTQAYIEDVLSSLSCKIDEPFKETGISGLTAFFDNGKPDTIAFRSDMDALPIVEKTDHDFKSLHENCMHACGHDGHMALLLGFAKELESFYRGLDVNILLIFQSGEETPGGAHYFIENGILEKYNVKRVYGTHLWPMIEKGKPATRAKELMARSSEVNIDFKGKASHAARYKEGIDALECAVTFIKEAYEMEKEIPDDVYRLLRFGVLKAGIARNIVAESARLEATLRAFDEETYWHMRNFLFENAKRMEEETGIKITISISDGYPAVINDESLVEEIFENIDGIEKLPVPEMISEDFSWYQKVAPGVFFFLGTGTGIPLHADTFDFDEKILLNGIELYKKLAYLGIK